MRHKFRAARPFGGHLVAVRGSQAVLLGEILPEPGGELLHAEHVHVFVVAEVAVQLQTDAVHLLVAVEKAVAIFAHNVRKLRKDRGVAEHRAVRKAHEEHILHPELFGPLAEIAQRLLIFRAQLQRFDLTLAGLHFRDDLKGLGQRIAGPAHGQLLFGRSAPDVRLDPGVMVLCHAEKIGRLLVFRHAVCDRLHLVA